MATDISAEPPVNWVSTSKSSDATRGSVSAGGTPGSGANAITRAGLPNADPDGFDVERSDLDGVDVGGAQLSAIPPDEIPGGPDAA
jgi:hypothetical protein